MSFGIYSYALSGISVAFRYFVAFWYLYGDTSRQLSSRNQNDIPASKTEVGKTKVTIRYLYIEHIVSRVSSYFPIGGHSITRALHLVSYSVLVVNL